MFTFLDRSAIINNVAFQEKYEKGHWKNHFYVNHSELHNSENCGDQRRDKINLKSWSDNGGCAHNRSYKEAISHFLFSIGGKSVSDNKSSEFNLFKPIESPKRCNKDHNKFGGFQLWRDFASMSARTVTISSGPLHVLDINVEALVNCQRSTRLGTFPQ